jgi:nitrite reductase/ring-hydroxylating ferredoxin subunit
MKKVKVGNKEFLVADVNGNYYAMRSKCTHTGGDLSQGSYFWKTEIYFGKPKMWHVV